MSTKTDTDHQYTGMEYIGMDTGPAGDESRTAQVVPLPADLLDDPALTRIAEEMDIDPRRLYKLIAKPPPPLRGTPSNLVFPEEMSFSEEQTCTRRSGQPVGTTGLVEAVTKDGLKVHLNMRIHTQDS
jgi:hypothetical protein